MVVIDRKILVLSVIFCSYIYHCFFIADVKAKPIVADLAIRSVDINHDFNGINILLFGARNDAGKIVVLLRGPERNYIVRKKEKIGGLLWMNKKSVEFENVSSLYAIASTVDLSEIQNDNLLKRFEMSVDNIKINAIPEHHSIKSKKTISEFSEAFKRLKIDSGLYDPEIKPISFWGETLFRTSLKFHKNLEDGWYTAEVYLIQDGVLSAMQSTPIKVSKIGFEALIFDLAHKNSLLYGLLCVFMAISAGWGASKIFGRV